ncbi:hypothetical protein [Sebaldella sp. S0638]|uniref:hypothetical protein n=1 Tax=Sebaldella sp. S0638 TaxID=2957809 RepID=UPI0020A0A223|nr:hypothetical protein [Sebaldella sp. S0638]MCP1224740.1 hypothetical protein [Sebaldella sp. S0638]
MIKKIIGIIIVTIGLYEVGFSGGKLYANGKNTASETKERIRYEEVYSGYSDKIDLLYKRLDEKNTAISDERRRKNPDYKKVERLENEKRIVKRELDSTYADLRYDLRQNRVRDYSYKN